MLLFRFLGARWDAANDIVYPPREREKNRRKHIVHRSGVVDRRFGLTRSSTLVCTGSLNVLVGHACAPAAPPSRWHPLRHQFAVGGGRRAHTYEGDGDGVVAVVSLTFARVYVCTRRRGCAYVSAEWRQEPRRHVTGAPPLRSSCRRGFAPAILRRATQRRRRRRHKGEKPRRRLVRTGVRATYCAEFARRRGQSTLDDRTSRIEHRAIPRIRETSSFSLCCIIRRKIPRLFSTRVHWKTRSRCLMIL